MSELRFQPEYIISSRALAAYSERIREAMGKMNATFRQEPTPIYDQLAEEMNFTL